MRVFCPRAGLSLQTQAPRLQFCPKACLQPQTQTPRVQFYRCEDCGYYTCSSVWKRGKIHLLSPSICKLLNDDPQNSPSKVTKPVHQQKEEREREREKYTKAGPQSHTQKRNPILVEEHMYVQYSYSRPLHHIFQMGVLLAWPTVARDGKSIYLAMKIYRCSSR